MTAQRTYPLTPADVDERFTFWLLIDVAELLEKHGYTRPVAYLDLIELRQALFGFLYSADHERSR
ncbi:hypothetical protein AB0M54_26945 [Actinoplanes sp. NPDC051470]|uniref:hypothetical protein n=1 Tax=Actinoplanes sp. NPDC051470 TaxID=3157224 RepID=UPI003433807B